MPVTLRVRRIAVPNLSWAKQRKVQIPAFAKNGGRMADHGEGFSRSPKAPKFVASRCCEAIDKDL